MIPEENKEFLREGVDKLKRVGGYLINWMISVDS